jgi:hypothetical protein
MARCACGTGTCSCVVKGAPDGGVTVVGNGSANRPYLISVPGGNPLLNLDVVDDPTLDLTISGAGTATDKRRITGRATQSLTNLKDVQGTPVEGEIPVWRTDHWEFEAAAAAGLPVSGSWGTPPLNKYGLNSLQGREIYLDVNSQLRSKPDVIETSAGLYDSTTPIDSYPAGTSVMSVSSAEGVAHWPAAASCTVVTHKRVDTTTAGQWCFINRNDVSKAWYRNANTTLWGPWIQVAGLFSGQGIASASAFAPGAAQTDIPGMAVTVPVAGPTSKFAVDINLDLSVAVASNSNFIAALAVPGGGADSVRQIVYNGGSATAAPVGTRLALSQHYLITGLGASPGTVFKATAAGTNWRVQASHSALTVAQIA